MRFAGSEDDTNAIRPLARRVGWVEQDRHPATTGHLGVGSLACPRCDAPVSIGPAPVRPDRGLVCPFCDHSGALREFLSLSVPTRPARVVVRVLRTA
jgi:hypothetical protein